MSLSFRDVATFMDPVRPANRFRGTPIEDTLDWLSIDGEYEYPEANKTTIRAVMEKAGLGHKHDKGLQQVHRYQDAQRELGSDRSLRELMNRHEQGKEHKFLFLNTWLLNTIDFADKPLLEERRHEIGRALNRDGYEIIGLCEVFDDSEIQAITEKLTRPIDTETGPDAAFQESSGLLTIVTDDRTIVSSTKNPYDAQGGLFESDTYATKGVLYTEIDLHPASNASNHIDLYTTHAHATEKDVRSKQIAELASTIAKTTQPQNVTVVAGDFNVDVRKPEYREMLATLCRIDVPIIRERGYPENLHRYVADHRWELSEQLVEDALADVDYLPDRVLERIAESTTEAIRILDRLGLLPFNPFQASATEFASHFDWTVETHVVDLDDLWMERGGIAGATHKVQEYDTVCALDDEHSPDGYSYCRDYDVPKIRDSPASDTVPGYRLDYVFVEEPVDTHSFNLDMTRIRRRPFWRSEDPNVGHMDPTKFMTYIDIPELSVTVGFPAFMSDHMGLEVTFVSSSDSSEYRTRRFE